MRTCAVFNCDDMEVCYVVAMPSYLSDYAKREKMDSKALILCLDYVKNTWNGSWGDIENEEFRDTDYSNFSYSELTHFLGRLYGYFNFLSICFNEVDEVLNVDES